VVKFGNLALLLVCIFLIVSVSCDRGKKNDANSFVVIHFNQGCSVLCPQELKVVDSTDVKKVEAARQSFLEEVRPQLIFPPKKGAVLGIAASGTPSKMIQLQVMLGPPELSQTDVKAFTPEKAKALEELMFRQVEPALKSFGYNVTKRHQSKIIQGRHLTYFLWAYEFTDESMAPRISLRSYYYTRSATFIVSFSCPKEYYDKNQERISTVLGSLNSSEISLPTGEAK
jgi:hypothetical protein